MYEQSLTIDAERSERQYWRDIWTYRELLYLLAWRDLLVRYKQTVVGVAWALIRPFLTMLILTVLFGRLSKMPSGNAPYPLLVLCGMLPWQFFSTALTESGGSLVTNANLISKVYFPRIVVPMSCVITSFVDFLISVGLMALLMAWYHFIPATNIAILPLFAALAFIFSIGLSVWVAAVMVKYRDFRFIVPFVVQFGLYVSPVGFSSSVIPDQWRLLYSMNPMVGVIDGFRWCILGSEYPIYWPGLAISICVVAIIVVTGIWYFRRIERTMADVI